MPTWPPVTPTWIQGKLSPRPFFIPRDIRRQHRPRRIDGRYKRRLVGRRHVGGNPGVRAGDQPHLPLQIRTGDAQAEEQSGAGLQAQGLPAEARGLDGPPIGGEKAEGRLVERRSRVDGRRALEHPRQAVLRAHPGT